MGLRVRRVVTGHRPDGRATILLDEASPAVERPGGGGMATMWATNAEPLSNEGFLDEAATASRFDNGTVFRVVSHAPGAEVPMHRTDTLDYLYILSGEIEMEMDDGTAVRLGPGDTVVQRGTAHRWRNPGAVPCVIAFVMLRAAAVAGVPPLEPLR